MTCKSDWDSEITAHERRPEYRPPMFWPAIPSGQGHRCPAGVVSATEALGIFDDFPGCIMMYGPFCHSSLRPLGRDELAKMAAKEKGE